MYTLSLKISISIFQKGTAFMDVFTEQLVRRPSDGKTAALRMLIMLGTVILAAACILFMLMGFVIVFLLIFAVIYAGFYLFSGLNVEYEYIITNGEIDIDKIIAKRKRKRLITAKPSKFERFGKLSDAADVSGITVVEAKGYSDDDTAEDYYIDFQHDSFGAVRLIFTPSKRTLEAIVPFLPRAVKVEYEKNK